MKIYKGELVKPKDELGDRKKGSKHLGGSIKRAGTRHHDRLSFDSSSSRSNSDRGFERHCCKRRVMSDHTKPEWSLGFEWARQDFKVPNLIKKAAPGATTQPTTREQEVSLRKVKELRRKQFFNFLVDFFDKFEAGEMKYKVPKKMKFTPEEKEK